MTDPTKELFPAHPFFAGQRSRLVHQKSASRQGRALCRNLKLRLTSAATIPFGQMIDPDNDSMTIPCEDEIEAIQCAHQLSKQRVSLREIAKRIGPIRGKIMSPQSMKRLITKWSDD